MTALNELTIQQMADALAEGSVTSVDLTEACLGRIAETAELNSFVHVDDAGARAAAEQADLRRKQEGARSALDGIPIALKDNIVTLDVPTTAGSRILAGHRPPYDATVTRKLKSSGAVLVGKTNLDEFAMGSSSEHSVTGPVLNPWDRARVPGGSSGGSAAAVASRQVPGAFGTDTGGSIRQPAALCGVYGFKPTYGRVSRHGIIAYASSLDQVGPFARTIEDCALLLEATAGFDERDSTSAAEAVPDYRAAVDAPVAGLRVGLPEEYFGEGIDPEVDSAVRAAIEVLAKAGADVRPVRLPHTPYVLSAYYLIATAEASSNLARYDGVRYGVRVRDRDLRSMIARSRQAGFGEEVQRRIVLGTYVLSAGYYDAYYGRAQKVRTLVRRDFEAAFAEVDVLATPTSPTCAFRLGEHLDDPLSMYMTDVCTLAVNLAGVPALNVPAGLSREGLPIGLQLIGPWFAEARLIAAAAQIERSTPHAAMRPDSF